MPEVHAVVQRPNGSSAPVTTSRSRPPSRPGEVRAEVHQGRLRIRGRHNAELPKPGTVAVEELQALLAGIAVQLARVDRRLLRTGTER